MGMGLEALLFTGQGKGLVTNLEKRVICHKTLAVPWYEKQRLPALRKTLKKSTVACRKEKRRG